MHPQHQNDPPRSSSVCGSIEKGLSWSPFNPMFNDDDDDDVDSIEKASEHVKIKKPNKISLKKVLSRVFSNTISSEKGSIFKNSDNVNANARVSCSTSLSDELRLHNNNYLDDYDDGGGYGCENLHMAQGKGGEDRMHIVICEEHGWVYVESYDGFSGPDATGYLLNDIFLCCT
jgi:pyruvate dehydrogenase phosphatase